MPTESCDCPVDYGCVDGGFGVLVCEHCGKEAQPDRVLAELLEGEDWHYTMPD